MRSVFIVVNYAHGHGMIPTNLNDLTGLYLLAKPQYHHRQENVIILWDRVSMKTRALPRALKQNV